MSYKALIIQKLFIEGCTTDFYAIYYFIGGSYHE
jgi:hypothetical protein